ncbi:MAG: choice-of-anchor I family protein, partial [Bacteroidia bacterium]|nr:choice-of-anchor I family protein [Bacteroidia bacterium]
MQTISTRWHRWLLSGLAFLLCGPMMAQTTGDIAFVGFNADGNDGFAFVTFVDIPANTNIWFTDEEWDGVANAFASLTGEGDVVWSNSAVTLAGTVIDVDGLSSTPVASLGTVAPGTNGGAGLSSTAEGIYAYLGAQRAPTTFLTAINNDVWGGSAGSLTGTGLVAGATAIEFGNATDVAAYVGPRLGQSTFPAYSAGIYDLATNWIFQDGAGDQHNDGTAPDVPFDITPFALGTSDLTPPLPISATITSATTVMVEFNEALDATTAATIANYTFAPALTISAATFLNTDSVELTFAAFASGVAYQLSILGVADTAGNAMTSPAVFELIFNNSTPSLVITEIMYNNPSDDSLEFLEIYNAGASAANLGGLTFSEGIDFTFPQLSLAAGATVLLAVDTASASSFFGVPFVYQFGGALGNGGESLLLVNSLGDTIDQVIYDDASPWPLGPPSPDGGGPSIELINPSLNNNVGVNWFASTTFAGTDGTTTDIFATPGTVSLLTAASVSIDVVSQSVKEDTGSVMIVVTLNGSSADTVKAKLALTAFGTATNGSDFMVSDTTLISFLPNVSGQTDTIMVSIMDDSDAETDEYFSFRLGSVENADLAGAGTQLVYIRDNDRIAPVGSGSISLNLLSSYQNAPTAGANSAEIVGYDPVSQRLFIANSVNNSLDIVDMSDPAAPVAISSVDMSLIGDLTSIAVDHGLVAVSAANPNAQLPGTVTFFDTTGVQLSQVTTGALPDMVVFTHDGNKVLTANEGQPSDDYTNDPEGSISIIDISGGVATLTQADVTTAGFTTFNGQVATLESNGVRISGISTTTVAEDMEPEYITISSDNLTAWVACQENNAVAVVDLMTNTVTNILGLGTKEWSTVAGLDAEDDSDEINIANYPFKGLYMPDAIASYEIAGVPYLVTANEGDAREYAGLVDESRLSDFTLDSAAFPNGDILQSVVGRIKTLNTEGDIDNDGDYDEIYTLGGRSFSIWNGTTGALVYDSGDDLELITSQDLVFGAIFNSNDDGTSAKNRSDDKGPEPEGVTTGVVNGKTYAFVTLERIGGVMVYDVTDPAAPVFVQYVNSKLSNGDFAPEGVIFIPSAESPTGKPLLITANEVSSTLAIFEIGGEITGEVEFADASQTIGEDIGSVSVVLTLTNGTPDSTITVEVELGTFSTALASVDFTASATQTVTVAPNATTAPLS